MVRLMGCVRVVAAPSLHRSTPPALVEPSRAKESAPHDGPDRDIDCGRVFRDYSHAAHSSPSTSFANRPPEPVSDRLAGVSAVSVA